MERIVVFGQEVPQSEVAALLAEGWTEEELTTENLETYYWYDYYEKL